MRNPTATIAALSLLLGSTFLYAAEQPDQPWLDFTNALGQAAMIGMNADHELALTAYRPIQAFDINELDQNRLRLGFDLFHERRLSVDNSVGCNSCHSGMFGGTDGRQVSTGANGVLGHLNSPTTFNAAMNFRQFWDGRAVTLTDQATGPIESELEMAHNLDAVVDMLTADASYPAEFASIYPDGITVHNMADALAYFQAVNFTRANTPFIRHLNGEEEQLSEQALRGWKRFDEVGCVSCHNGINLGGNSYQQLGVASSYFVEHRIAGPNDNGVFNRTRRPDDLHVFKVPTLHGVAETAPYFHDGSIETLEMAIEEMAEHQLGRQLSEEDVEDIAAFLRSLGGRGMGMPMMMGNMGMGRGMGMREEGGQAMAQGGMRQGGGMRMGQGGGMNQGAGMRMGQGRMNAEPADNTEAPAEQRATPAAPQGSHNEAYLSAIATTESAINKLTAEMQRIHSGDVAHYDFLQYEHLELIRHARALQHPPSSLGEADRAKLTAQAEQLLMETHQLEWIISDFLRAQAMIKILTTHISTPEQSDYANDLGDPAIALANHQKIALAKINELMISNVGNTVAQLNSAFLAAR